MQSYVSRVTCLAIVSSFIGAATVWLPPLRGQVAPRPVPVQLLARTAPPPAAQDPADRGATYYWLEGLATRQTTSFGDAVATTERASGGDLRTRLTDTLGNELAVLAVDRVRPGLDVIDYRPASGSALRAATSADVRVTMDWSNRQAYALWRDQAAGVLTNLEWQSGLMRTPAGRRRAPDLVVQTTVEWPDGLTATTKRIVSQRKHVSTGVSIRGTTLEGRLMRRGLAVGTTRWFAEEQVYAWSIPGRSEGYLDPERLKRNNGWHFTPDAAWVNVQSFAFEHFGQLIAENGFVAKSSPVEPGWLHRITNAIVPTLSANTAGCDGLHWLDGTVVRACCDMHDYCYEKYSCDYTSWWRIFSSWQCDFCNFSAAFCFLTTGRPWFLNS